jgi:hypothetical protein
MLAISVYLMQQASASCIAAESQHSGRIGQLVSQVRNLRLHLLLHLMHGRF